MSEAEMERVIAAIKSLEEKVTEVKIAQARTEEKAEAVGDKLQLLINNQALFETEVKEKLADVQKGHSPRELIIVGASMGTALLGGGAALLKLVG